MREHLVAGCGHLGTGHGSLTGLRPGLALLPAPLSLPWAGQGGGWGQGSCWAALRAKEQVFLVGRPGDPQGASRPLPQPALPKCHLPAHLTRLGHRRSLSSVSRRAIAYSLTSSDTPTIYSTRQRTPHVQGDP